MINWNDYKNFTEDEFRCSYSGHVNMDKEFMDRLQELRDIVGEPFIISSGYRSVSHPAERNKTTVGEHTLGKACDILCYGDVAYKILRNAVGMFPRIGINQKGDINRRFIHLGIGEESDELLSPWIWTY